MKIKQEKKDYIKLCYHFYGQDHNNFKSIKIAENMLDTLYEMKSNEKKLGIQIVEEMMNSLSLEDDFYIDMAEILASIATKGNISEIEELMLISNVENTKNQYEKVLKLNYHKNK